MPAERAGYTVTMFLVDVSRSMGKLRAVELPPGPDGEERVAEITNLEWSLQFVKLKIQEMIYNGRKTDQCGVILFGSEETNNIINEKNGGYDNVSEYIPIAQPNANTLAKLHELQPSSTIGDPIDALIVGIETQANYLGTKKWTRKIVIVTDGDNPIEIEDWEAIVKKMDGLDITLTIVGVDFDDDEFPFIEEDKSHVKATNEKFFHTFVSAMKSGVIGTCALALRETNRPDIKQTRSALMETVLRVGDPDVRDAESIALSIKTCKCTAIGRPKSWKKFAIRPKEDTENVEEDAEEEEAENDQAIYAQLKMRTEYYVDRSEDQDEDEDIKEELEEEDLEELERKQKEKDESLEKVEKEELVRGFKYGTTWAPCPDGQFPRLPTMKGIDICGFFPSANFRRELSMGEVQYIWANPDLPQAQVALSSIVQAMDEKGSMAIARWVTKDGMDPKMGVLMPTSFEKVDCLLWAQMPFADDVRKYTFASLDHLVNKKGEVLESHPYIPTDAQIEAMDNFVDAMDLMQAGEKDEEGNRMPWFDPRLSYNPSVHRTKQSMFHCAVVKDLDADPLPPPHPELLKYFDPPKKVVKRAQGAVEGCKNVFKVRQVPKRVAKAKKDGHEHAAADDNDDMLLLDRKQPSTPRRTQQTQAQLRFTQTQKGSPSPLRALEKAKAAATRANPNDSDTEDDEDEADVSMVEVGGQATEEDDNILLLDKKPAPVKGIMEPPLVPSRSNGRSNPLPTPARSLSPPSRRPPNRELTRLSIEGDVDMVDGEANSTSEKGKAKDESQDSDWVMDIDPGRAPGRIIGSTWPLKDFKNNTSRGDVVTKAVEDLAWVITDIVTKPFAMKRADEMIECMKTLRNTCLHEDEIDAWNKFLREVRDKNTEFWDAVKKNGRGISLISSKEAQATGGTSEVTEIQAKKFVA
ncbi:SPOC domain-like protein [Pluteus cervinus]|uniref:SPOC domain-like protein n=1 Tax=Pluteus cervinus TaxID=181527 RepID=A0ACD3BEV5_9AGAR|nr:SPOC domain-like protein [Pluteus cervinus]